MDGLDTDMATNPKKKTVKAGTSQGSAEQRRKLFIEAYIANGGNGTEAAIAAGFSKKTAASQASRLLKDVKMQEEIADRAEKVAKKYELTTELVIRSLCQDLNFDPARLYNEDGTLKSITELDEDTRMSLTAAEFEQIGSQDAPSFVRKVKWANKKDAREQAMKHLGMFEKDNDQSKPNVTIVFTSDDADL